ncbi:MAG: hypothetical protein HY903_02030 [Deltaproteobacteria bacterium]|nr:hypothetical protein [Deltaproteobacteria bacterium]
MRVRRWWWIVAIVVAVIGVAVVSTTAAVGVVSERRRILLQHAESEVVSVAESVATMVHDRERDMRNDMSRVIEASKYASHSRERTLELVRSHLIGLNRSTRHYLRLWYLEEGKVVTEVSGFRLSEVPLPKISPAELKEIDKQARANPDSIAGFQASVPIDSPYDSLRLLGLANRRGDSTVVLLVNMRSVFDALQARATLPGLDLWVVDLDGSVLVDPESPWHKEVLAAIRSGPPNGQTRLGPSPSLWPFSTEGLESQILAWRTVAGQPFPWATAVAAPLDSVTGEVHAVAAVALLLASLVLMGVLTVAALLFYLANRQVQLKERLESLAMIDTLREQLLHLEKLSTIGQVAAGVAHEMGTPLGVIAIRIEQMLERATDDKQKSALTVMREQIDRINRIIRSLLDSSRPTAARMQPLSVRDATRQVAELVAQRYEAKKIKLTVEVPEQMQVFANPDQFQQVCLNLLVNAGDACRPGDHVVVRALETPDDSGRVAVEIADSGPGIPEAVMPSIFEPFFTTKPPGEGTGLGLTIVREIMQRHEGKVELKSGGAGTHAVTWWHVQDPQHEAASDRNRPQAISALEKVGA